MMYVSGEGDSLSRIKPNAGKGQAPDVRDTTLEERSRRRLQWCALGLPRILNLADDAKENAMKIAERAKRLMEQGRTIAFATCTRDGIPNVVPILHYWWFEEGTLVVGDVSTNATRKNLEEPRLVSFCVWDDETGEAYVFRGSATYETDGPAYIFANDYLRRKEPDESLSGVVVVAVIEICDASREENACKLMVAA